MNMDMMMRGAVLLRFYLSRGSLTTYVTYVIYSCRIEGVVSGPIYKFFNSTF
jgi:hypothetical protein